MIFVAWGEGGSSRLEWQGASGTPREAGHRVRAALRDCAGKWSGPSEPWPGPGTGAPVQLTAGTQQPRPSLLSPRLQVSFFALGKRLLD